VVAVFERIIAKADLRFGAKVLSVVKSGSGFDVVSSSPSGDRTERFDAVVLST